MRIQRFGLDAFLTLLVIWVGGVLLPGAAWADIFVLDDYGGTVGQFNLSGIAINRTLISGLEYPNAMAVTDSYIYIVEAGGRISQYTTSGAVVNPSLISGLNEASGITVSGTDLFVVNFNAGTIGQYTTSGATVNPALISGLHNPTSVAVSGANLFVTNYATGTIGQYTTSGAVVNPALISGLSYPVSIANAGADLFVLSDAGVGRYTTSGSPVNPSLIPVVGFTTAFAVSGSDLYVNDFDGIHRFSTSGTTSTGPLAPLVPLNFLSASIVVTATNTLPPAGQPILNIDPGTQVSNVPTPGKFLGGNARHGDGMIGWTFTLLQPVTVTQVGWYDDGQDGLSRDFQVGLWKGTGTNSPQLLGSPTGGITITAGTAARAIGTWRVVDLPEPLVLQSGYYVLGGLDTATTPDTIVSVGTWHDPDMVPALTESRLSIGGPYGDFDAFCPNSPGFHEPEWFYLVESVNLGPMLFISVPEPSTFFLIGAGAMMLAARPRRRRT